MNPENSKYSQLAIMVSKLSHEVLQSFEMRIGLRSYLSLHENHSSIQFSANGNALIASRNDNTIETFNCNTSQRKIIPSKKYGCGLIDFCNNDENILVTSTIRDNAVRELCIEKNLYVTCFLGHTDSITALAVHPNDKNTFLTGSLDKKILLYDIRVAAAQAGQTHFPDTPLISWNPNGMMFAVGLDENSNGLEVKNGGLKRISAGSKGNTVRLYDIRGLGNGPVMKFNFNAESSAWQSLKFSPDGDKMLISTNGTKVRVIDSFSGKVLRVYGGKLTKHYHISSFN